MKHKNLAVGFTYDLRDEYLAQGFTPEQAAEFDKPATIDAIAAALASLGCRVDRIGNLKSLVNGLAQGRRWDIVFNIAEGVKGYAREAEIPALLEGYGIPCVFSSALTLAVCLHKSYAKQLVKAAGIPTPAGIVVDDAETIDCSGLAFPLFAKPVAEGTGKGVTPLGKIDSPDRLALVCRDLLDRFSQPVLVEEFLPGREFTVGIVGSGKKARVIGAMEVTLLANAQPLVYSYDNKDKYEDRVRYSLAGDEEAQQAAATALAAYRALDCRDAGRVDLRSDANGKPHFMEINPLAGLDHIHSDLPIMCRLRGVDFPTLIDWIMTSAEERL